MVDGQANLVKIDLLAREKQASGGDVHRDHKVRGEILRGPVGGGVDLVGGGDLRIPEEVGRLAQAAQGRAEPGGAAHRVSVRAAVGQDENVVLLPQQPGGFLSGHRLLTFL